MRIPLSKRLRCCAQLVPRSAAVADIGCDHGYLGIFLLKNEQAGHVWACDLREKPLQRAQENALRFGVAEHMSFRQAFGLRGLCQPCDTVVCAGMGGDTIASIIQECPWLRSPEVTLVLQPQSSGNDLRRELGQQGFRIVEEQLVQDGGFLYFAMQVRYGGGHLLSPGEQYLSRQLLDSGSPLLPAYFMRVLHGLESAVAGLEHANQAERYGYYQTALQEVQEMKRSYDKRTGHL